MSIKTTLAMAAAVSCFYALAAPGQTNSTATNDLFRLTFRASSRALNSNATQLVSTTITETNIIANALGETNTSNSNLLKGFVLVYNTGADSIQVVDTNGALVNDVIDFGGGASTPDDRERARLTFMFVPGVSNAIGSAIIDEIGVRSVTGQSNNFANIFGKVQFVLTGNTELGSTNTNTMASASTGGNTNNTTSGTMTSTNMSTNTLGLTTNFLMTTAFDDPTARVASGFFFTGSRVPPPSTSTTSGTTSSTRTSGTTGTTGTAGTTSSSTAIRTGSGTTAVRTSNSAGATGTTRTTGTTGTTGSMSTGAGTGR